MPTVKIQKWGNSLALRLPMTLARDAALGEGTPVRVSIEGGRIVIEPSDDMNLADLVDQINDSNLHGEVTTGRRQGNETW